MIPWKVTFWRSIQKGEGKDFIDSLLQTGVDIKVWKRGGQTVLSHAAASGNLDIVKFVLLKGADSHVKNCNGTLPLHIAAKYGHADVVEFLLELGVYVFDTDKYTPLHFAAEEGHTQIVKLLIEKGADLNAKCNNVSPLLLAASNTHKEVVELLLASGANGGDCFNRDKWTVLHMASRNGWLEIVRSLVEAGSDVHAETSRHMTSLHVAALYEHEEIVELFISLGANFEGGVFADEATLLHMAAQNGWVDVVRSLAEAGLDVNAKTSRNMTPLQIAALCAHKEVVELLIALGGRCEGGIFDDGMTLLHVAAQSGWLDIVRSLVETGYDINAVTSHQATSIMFAALYEHKEVVELLIASGANCDGHILVDKMTLLHLVARHGWLEVVRSLVKAGVNVNAKTFQDMTALHIAALCNHKEIVELLIASGATCEARPVNDKMTVLHIAFQKGWVEAVQSLVKAGTNLHAKTGEGVTPLHFSLDSKRKDFVTAILKTGVDCNIKNEDGDSIFNFYITKRPSVDEIKLFVENGVYVESDEYNIIFQDPLLKMGILQNAKVCTQAIINKFNNSDLPAIYKLPICAKSLPSMENLKLLNNRSVALDIEQSVEHEIKTKGHCNLPVAETIALLVLCVKSCISYYQQNPGFKQFKRKCTFDLENE